MPKNRDSLWIRYMHSLSTRVISDIDTRLKFKVKPGDKVLDIGCGSGIVGRAFCELFDANLTSIDTQNNLRVKVPFTKLDGEKIPFKSNSFDFALIFFVLHHLENPETILKEAGRVAKYVLVAEDTPIYRLQKISCWLHLSTYEQRLNKRVIRDKSTWESLFKNAGMEETEESYLNCFNPRHITSRTLFVLRKK